MSRRFDWTPDMLTELRHAWHTRPGAQSATEFDRAFASKISGGARTVQRARIYILGLKSNPRRVTR
jgi:hypothetical protein